MPLQLWNKRRSLAGLKWASKHLVSLPKPELPATLVVYRGYRLSTRLVDKAC
jgi:hypothetical protein